MSAGYPQLPACSSLINEIICTGTQRRAGSGFPQQHDDPDSVLSTGVLYFAPGSPAAIFSSYADVNQIIDYWLIESSTLSRVCEHPPPLKLHNSRWRNISQRFPAGCFFVKSYSFLQGFGAGLFWGGSGSGNFCIRNRLRLLVKEKKILEFLKTEYKVSKIRYTCPSTCRSYFMFTLEKTSNYVPFNFRELLNK